MKRITRFGMWQIKTLQYGALLSVVFFASVASWSVWSVLGSVCAYYAYSAIGVSMMMHRYYSHRAFEFKWPWMKYPLTLVAALAGRGSPLAWVHIHRTHHRHADQDGDPHRPGDSLKVFSFGTTSIQKFSPARVADLLGTKLHRWLHDYYLLVMVTWASTLLLLGGFNLLYFGWLLPMVMYQVAQDIWNYYGHKETFMSYKNWGESYLNGRLVDFNESVNNSLLYPLVLGEAWHNNHHKWPNNYRLSYREYEKDPVAWIIERIKSDEAVQ
jgi:stearoyl-CoA desaturase (delta-9 desaturase)